MNKTYYIDKTISLYEDVGWKKWFSKIRFWDAPYIEIEALVPKKGTIVDLGCGEGIFTNFMALSSPERKILGVEIDETRISQADHGLANVSFRVDDATKVKIPGCKAIVLFHLLHHLESFSDQERVIKNCLKALKKGGKLIIVEVNIKLTFKYLLSWLADHFIVPILFEKKLFEPYIYFRKKEEWLKLLGSLGFSCKVIPAELGKPFTHIIFDCTKNG